MTTHQSPWFPIVTLLLALLSVAACARQPLPAATSTSQASVATSGEVTTFPTATTTPLPTPSPAAPTATATPMPSATPAPTETALPSPSPTATPLYCPEVAPAEVLEVLTSRPLRVFFVERGDLRVWDEATDTTETLVEGRVYRLYLSPDGETVAFLRQEEPGMISDAKQMALWAVDADGENERLLIGGEELRALGPARVHDIDVEVANPIRIEWLPGAQALAYGLELLGPNQCCGRAREVHLLDTETGAQRLLLATETDTSFTFSPDGLWMSLADDTGIDLLALEGGNRINDVVTYPLIGLGGSVYHARPIWADDGREFSVPIPSANPFSGDATLTVWEVAAADGAARELATLNGFPLPVGRNLGSAIFSPDRSQIAFYRTPERSNMGDLLIADVEGTWQTVYDSGWGPRFLGWAPDGSRFAYTVGQERQRLLRIGRLCERPIVFDGPPPAGDTPVTWIDGERFLYQAQYGSAGPTTLLLGTLDGSVREIGQLAERQDSYAFRETGTYGSEAYGFQFAIPSGYVVVEYGHPDALLSVSLHERVVLADERARPKPEIFVTVHQNEQGLSVEEWLAAHTAETVTDTYPVYVGPRNVQRGRVAERPALSFEDMTWSHSYVTLLEGDGTILEIGYVQFGYPGLADAFEHVRQSLAFGED